MIVSISETAQTNAPSQQKNLDFIRQKPYHRVARSFFAPRPLSVFGSPAEYNSIRARFAAGRWRIGRILTLHTHREGELGPSLLWLFNRSPSQPVRTLPLRLLQWLSKPREAWAILKKQVKYVACAFFFRSLHPSHSLFW